MASSPPPTNESIPADGTADDTATAATMNDTLQDMSHAAKVAKTQDQLNEISKEIQESQALTSQPLPLDSLKPQYADTGAGSFFLLGIDDLASKYEYLRTTRRDGNCYYRAVWYQLCELLNHSTEKKEEAQRLLTFFKDESMALCTTKGGYEEVALEIFYDAMVEFYQEIVDGKLTSDEMHTQLTEEGGVSEYTTWYLRALAATWVKAHGERFLPYLEEEHMDIPQFCATNIEPVGSEATMVPIVALAECLGISVSIVYLDGHAFDPAKGLTKHVFGSTEDSKLELTLLYRPGHYDILYPKK